MKPSELTAEVVRSELESLIERYPDNKGAFVEVKTYYDSDEEFEDPMCIYFTDENGIPINSSYDLNQEVQFKTPVCIVGMWIEEFHPEFKQDEVIQPILRRNATIRSLEYGPNIPWNKDVQRLLMVAQDTQDSGGKVWSDINLDADHF